ncbi:MAG: hypothetical protein K5753_01510 [Clostridia bacterium]|nr:hypothetical protein [Clostridia bacterium]
MKFKRVLLILLIVLLIASIAVAGAACKKRGNGNSVDPTPTPTPGPDPTPGPTPGPGEDDPVLDSIKVPTSLSINTAGRATWSSVSGASGYEVDVNGEVLTAKFTNCDLMKVNTLPTDGRFVVKVRTVTSAGKSAWSEAVTYTYEGVAIVTPQVNGLVGTSLSWESPNASFKGIAPPYPVVTVAGVQHKLDADVTSFDLSSVSAKSEITLHYVADGHYLKDSTTVKYVYDPQANKLAFAAPANAYMEGDILHFAEVEGADIYYFKDVYNTVTSISGSDITSLSSDREGHFLVKEIWAGNTTLPIADSAPVSVTFFTPEQGEGTEASPFLISSAAHLRFIEFYEALGQPKYYKLTQDIAFKQYSPQNDEDYSNFYNLGSLSGVLDGDGHTLSNIVVYYKDGYSSIFDSITESGKIRNLKIANTAWRTWTNRTNDGIMHEKGGECAILAYTNNGLIENVTLVSGSVTAVKDGAAGLVSINRGTVKDCTAEADFTVYGANEAGVFVIYNAGVVEHCVNKGSVSGKASVGGVVGRNAGLVTKCANRGSVSGDLYTGGIVGYNYNVKDVAGMQYETMVSYCSNTGSVSGFAYSGGIVGRNGSDGFNEVGTDSYANVGLYGCYNRGSVSGIISIGGIAGQNYAYYGGQQDAGFGLRACYNSGDVNSVVAGFKSNRIYLSVAACSWAEVDTPKITAHIWKGSDTAAAAWPGIEMQKTKVGETDFYYIDLPAGFAANQLSGVIFCRVNPENNSEVFNQTVDITAVSGTDAAVYYINSDWTNANLVEPCWGAIAGYNNQIDSCYYISGSKVGGTNLALNATKGGTSGATAVTSQEMRAVASTLNSALGGEYFVSVTNQYPILKWESVDQQTGGGQ